MTLALNLPGGALTWSLVGSDEAWTVGEHALSGIAHRLDVLSWQIGGCKGQRPDPLPGPTEIREQQRKRERLFARAARFKARASSPASPSPTKPSGPVARIRRSVNR